MARRAKEDDVAVMTESAERRLLAGEEVKVGDIAAEFGVTPGLVHFDFGDRRTLEDAAWREILSASVDADLEAVGEYGARGDWDALLRHSLASGVVATDLEPRALAALVVALPLGLSAVLPDLDDVTRVAIADAWTAMLRAVLDPEAAGGAGRAG